MTTYGEKKRAAFHKHVKAPCKNDRFAPFPLNANRDIPIKMGDFVRNVMEQANEYCNERFPATFDHSNESDAISIKCTFSLKHTNMRFSNIRDASPDGEVDVYLAKYNHEETIEFFECASARGIEEDFVIFRGVPRHSLLSMNNADESIVSKMGLFNTITDLLTFDSTFAIVTSMLGSPHNIVQTIRDEKKVCTVSAALHPYEESRRDIVCVPIISETISSHVSTTRVRDDAFSRIGSKGAIVNCRFACNISSMDRMWNSFDDFFDACGEKYMNSIVNSSNRDVNSHFKYHELPSRINSDGKSPKFTKKSNDCYDDDEFVFVAFARIR